MSDIFGRSTSRPADGIKRRQIASMIKRYVTSGLNLVDVDPGEIVVFGDKQGKLKTSNLSLDDLLTKPPNATDDSIVVFKSGKLAPSHNIKILDKITEVEKDLDGHMKDYKQFRRNVIAKFFGAPLVVTPSLAEIKKDIEDTKKKLTDDITTINSRLDVVSDIKSISDLIEINKKSIEDNTSDIKDIKKVTDKVKIPHNSFEIQGLSYVVKRSSDDYLHPGPGVDGILIQFIWKDDLTMGIYRFSLISEHQFNIKIRAKENPVSILSQGVNVVLFICENKTYNYQITPVDPGVVRASYSYVLEYLSPI